MRGTWHYALKVFVKPLLKHGHTVLFRNPYAALPRNGSKSVNLSVLEPYKEEMNKDEVEIINNVINEYGKYPAAFQLTKITHTPGSPWNKTVARKGTLSEINNRDILEYYRKILQ